MSHEAFATWGAALAEVGDAGQALMAAIDRGDVIAALAASGEARHRRAQLARIEPPAALAGTVEELVALRALAPARAAAAITEQVVARWLARPVAGDAQLLATPLGAATIADLLLPPVWDAATDLVVLVGAGLGPVADMLLAFGQRRLIAMIPNAPAEGSAGYPAEVIVCRDLRETVAAVRTMDPCAPRAPGGPRRAGRAGGRGRGRGGAGPRGPQRSAHPPQHRRGVLADVDRAGHRQPAGAGQLADDRRDRRALRRQAARDRGPGAVAGSQRRAAARPARPRRHRGGQSRAPAAAARGGDAGRRAHRRSAGRPLPLRRVDLAEVGAIINGVTVHPSLFSLGAATTFSVAANAALDAWLLEGVGELAAIASGGSVATSAFGLALRWRCDPIVCVGLDLSFAGSQYYVDTCSDGAARAEVSADGTVRVAGWSDGFRAMKSQGGPAAPTERLIELPGWHGGTVRSTFMFGMFHRWFVEMAARLGSPTGPARGCTTAPRAARSSRAWRTARWPR
jgi:hypothetical protein